MVQRLRPQAETLSGSPQPNFVGYQTASIIAKRNPGSTDTGYPLGQLWVNKSGNTSYQLQSVAAGVANWALLGTDTGALNTLTGDSGGAISPSAGNINILGTASEITTTGSGSSITASLPSAIIAPGSLVTTTTLASGTTLTAGSSLAVTTSATVGTTLGVTGATTLAALTQVGTANINASGAAVTTIGTGGTGAVNIGNATGNTAVTGSLTASTSLTATLGNITATNGNLNLAHTGNKLLIHASTGASDSIGTATLGTGGTVTVSTTAVTASSLIFLSYVNCTSSLAAALSYGTIMAGTSFKITSQDTTDATSTVNYWIIN